MERACPWTRRSGTPAIAKHISSQGAFSDGHPPRVPEKNMEEAAKHGVE